MSEPTAVVNFPSTPRPKSVDRSFATRWKHEALFDAGYVGVPLGFLHTYALLNPPLTPGEALFVIHLMQFKWTAAAPFPSYATLARQMGVTDKSVRRHAQSLEVKKYLRRDERSGTTNRFELTPLFDALLQATQAQKTARKG